MLFGKILLVGHVLQLHAIETTHIAAQRVALEVDYCYMNHASSVLVHSGELLNEILSLGIDCLNFLINGDMNSCIGKAVKHSLSKGL